MSEPNKPDTLSEALANAERMAVLYEAEGHLTDEEKDLAARQRDLTQKRVRGRGDVQQILKIVECRRVLYRILEIGGPFRASFDPFNARQSDYNEGQRSVGIEVLKMILDADPNVYAQMINERQSDEKADQERKRKENLTK